MKRFSRVAGTLSGALVVLAVAAGCGGDGNDAAGAATSDVTVDRFVAAPAATGAPVLSVGGQIDARNAGEEFVLDVGMVEALGLREVEVHEPFERRTLRFSGIDLRALVEVAGVHDSATEVHVTALDDYQVDLTVDAIRAGGVILATRVDGRAIPVSEGGPIRIVFLDESKAGEDTDLWIWSVRHMEFR